MDIGGVLSAMHLCITQGDTFRRVEKDGRQYYKILDAYYPFDTPTTVRTFDSDNNYTVGTIATFYLNKDNPSYQQEAAELGVELLPRPHRKPIATFIEKGISTGLELSEAHTISIPATEFEGGIGGQQQNIINDAIEDRGFNEAAADENGRFVDTSTTSMRDLSQDLTADKLAQLASKVKLNRRGKGEKSSGFLLDAEISDKNLDHIDRYFKYKTRVHKNTTNCMDTAADFSSVLSLIASMRNRDNPHALPKPPSAPNLQKPMSSSSNNNNTSNSNNNSVRASIGYSRYDQEVFHNDETDEFQIQTGMSFHGTSFKKMDNLKSAAKPIVVESSSSRHLAGSLKRPHPGGSNSSNGNNASGKPQKRTSRTPIIIIPASGTALISMYNAIDILQELRFVSTEEKKRMNQKRENEVLIHHRKDNGQTVPYRVVDNPGRLNAEEWDRVVAVFVQGPAWQFKGWNWGGNPTTIFSHVCAFHLKFEDAKLDANVAKWSVEVLQLSKQKRHLDKAIFIRLWQKIEQFVIRNKPALRY